MVRTIRRINGRASESQVDTALGLAAVLMGLMLWAVIWQANIIFYQRAVIRSLSSAHFGG